MRIDSLRFTNPHGDELAARLDRPDEGEPSAYALFAHCFTCSKNLRAVGVISRALTEQGFGVLRFDFTGLGESEGDFADTNFSSNVDDLRVAAEYLTAHYGPPRLLVGHSLGGAAVLQAAGGLDAVQAVATIGAPCNPEHVTNHLEDSIEEIEATGQARVTLAGRTFTIKKQFLDDLSETSMDAAIRGLKRPLMLFHAPLDETVGINNAAHIFELAKHPKSFVSLDDADHLLTDPDDAAYVGTVLGAWAGKYVDVDPVGADLPVSEAPDEADWAGDDGVSVRTGDGYRTEVAARTHRLLADEPTSVGGTDEGPTPYEYVGAGLASCTSITLRMYADRKEWPVDAIVVHVSHDRIHAKDCENCESDSGHVDRFHREIELHGDLTDDQRTRLIEIANKCPVHKTLAHNEIKVITHETTGPAG